MKKALILKIIKPVAFLLVVAVGLMAASFILAPKDNVVGSGMNNPNAHGFLSEPRDSIDVVVIGNSDAYSGFSPMEIWNAYGYTSYVCAEGRQLISGSIAMLKQVLSCQSPKVVILETDGLFTKSDVIENVVGMFNAASGNTFSVFQYHNRWKQLDVSNMLKKPAYNAHSVTKGQKMSNEVIGYTGGEYMKKSDDRAVIPKASLVGLRAFAELCEKSGAKLVLVEVPSQSSWNYKKHNAIMDWADENGVPFIDLNIDRDSFDFDWAEDSRDGGNHLNNRGAKKVSLYIGKYLSENFELDDRRGDPDFSRWNEDFENYIKDLKL